MWKLIYLVNICNNRLDVAVTIEQNVLRLNFKADKVKVLELLVVPETVQLKTIDDYLKRNIKKNALHSFFRNCIKIACSLDSSDEFHLIKGKKVWGN